MKEKHNLYAECMLNTLYLLGLWCPGIHCLKKTAGPLYAFQTLLTSSYVYAHECLRLVFSDATVRKQPSSSSFLILLLSIHSGLKMECLLDIMWKAVPVFFAGCFVLSFRKQIKELNSNPYFLSYILP